MGKRVTYFAFVAVMLGAGGISWGQKKASNPIPADGTADVAMPLLRWTAGSGAILHDVYLGKTPELGPQQLVGSHLVMTVFYYPAGLEPGVRYYWRVDEVGSDGTTVTTGDVWTFMTQALTAYNPDPADGAVTVSPNAVLKWWPGAGAMQHHVYLSDERDAVAQATAAADKGLLAQTETTFTPGTLAAGTTYYWRVDEVVAGGTTKAGPVWSFTTFVPIDDFESYTDEVKHSIFDAWIDGYSNGLSGSTVGYAQAPFAEQRPAFVHAGKQSMPLDYNNIPSPWYSEAELTFGESQDWTGNDKLVLFVRGRPVDFEVSRTSTPPVIDAQVDPAWSQASIQSITTKVDGAELTGPADCSGQFRALYDTDALYLLIEVNDDALVQDSDPAQGWLDDRIEVFIDGDNSKTAATDGKNDYQYCFRWNHGQVETPVEWYLSPGSLTGVKYGVVTTATGYTVEIKLPWSTVIGGPAKPGQLIGIDVAIDDDDGSSGGNRESQVAWYLRTTDPHHPNLWGTAILADATKPADPLYVAIQDAAKHKSIVVHPNPDITKALAWNLWEIPLSSFTGVNLGAVQKMYIGLGDRNKPVPGGAGIIFVDDIYLTRPAPTK